jgi:hypothetical protein
MSYKGPRKMREVSNIETLKAWAHWKRNEKDVTEEDLEFANAVNDIISQVGTWKAKHDSLAARVKELEEKDRRSLEFLVKLSQDVQALEAKLAAAEKALDSFRGHQHPGGSCFICNVLAAYDDAVKEGKA